MPKVYAEFYHDALGETRGEIKVSELRGQFLIECDRLALVVLDPYAARQLADQLHFAVDFYESEE